MASAATTSQPSLITSVSQFREIHKFSWLKKLTAEGKKVTVGPKKSERSWVVFCVHDDSLALLEGYAEPRQAASHIPEWQFPLHNTLHISHALIPNSHEFEFVVTLSNEVVKFHAMSWEIMQEWVETLRSKLREMKILSPCENVYTKLPEMRLPLLPTRDPTSPLPATPPVPAGLVPGVERILPPGPANISANTVDEVEDLEDEVSNVNSNVAQLPSDLNPITTANTVALTSMSNTRTQNLLNMLSDPISAYSDQINDETSNDISFRYDEETPCDDNCLAHEVALSELRNSEDPLLESAHVNICETNRFSDEIININPQFQCEGLLPRLQAPRSLSASAAEKSKKVTTDVSAEGINQCKSITPSCSRNNSNITELEIGSELLNEKDISLRSAKNLKTPEPTQLDESNTNITIIQVSTNANKDQTCNEAATVSASLRAASMDETKQFEYKSNVQIIPSNMNNIQVNVSSVANNYSMPVKKDVQSKQIKTGTFHSENENKITTLHVTGDTTTADTTAASFYGTCYLPTTSQKQSTPKLPKKVILSANVTNITVTANIETNNQHEVTRENNCDAPHSLISIECEQKPRTTQMHYDKVFLSSSKPMLKDTTPSRRQRGVFSSTSSLQSDIQTEDPSSSSATCSSPLKILASESSKAKTHIAKPISTTTTLNSSIISTTTTIPAITTTNTSVQSEPPSTTNAWLSFSTKPRLISSPPLNVSLPPLPARRQFLTRGATEAAITARPSRRDFHLLKFSQARKKNSVEKSNKNASTPNNNVENSENVLSAKSSLRTAIERADLLEHRRRSSSTSDAQSQQHNRTMNNNESTVSGLVSLENEIRGGCVSPPTVSSQPIKHMSLREQQIIQLRREIMHPAGVRLKLRRKDCIGSIAFIDAFGAVWVAGWKQKEHPVLYNAMHIGDQVLSIAGVAISSAVETNKIIRNTNTLFVEILIRRMPFARGYAIRRERDGQCLGLIRDTNTSTIVDVVPNSLAARNGLPPKARSCDGTTLTFWVLTEINGRPLNLFFKENEIRDRLNAVGRDISILVQPSDLITKLKKQLKSLRSYKDYLVE